MHLDDKQLQRLLHGELRADARRSVHAHLAECESCRARSDAARREEDAVVRALRSLDEAERSVSPRDVIARARVRSTAWMRWAAALLLAVGVAGVAAAAPGSPFGGWLTTLVKRVAGRSAPASAPTVTPPDTGPMLAGIGVEPGAELTIELARAPRGGHARVSLSDGGEVRVQTRGGDATFRSAPNRLVVAAVADSATVEISIPRNAPRVEIIAEGRRLFVKHGARITTAVAADAAGIYVIPFSPTSR